MSPGTAKHGRQAPAPKPPRRKLLSPASHPAYRLRYIDAAVGSESNSARSLAISFCTLSKCCAVL